MTDIRERFGAFDRLDIPNLWDDAQHREPQPANGSDRNRARKAIVIVTALTLTVATTGVMIRAFKHVSNTEPVTGTPVDWPTGTVQDLGLSFRYPPQWRVQPFSDEMKVSFVGALISNTDLDFHHPTPSDGGSTTAWDLSDLPPDGVVISIEHTSGPPAPQGALPADTALPLKLSDAKLLSPQPDPLGSSPKPAGTEERYLGFVLNRQPDEVHVFFAPDASAESRAAAAEVVASIGSTLTPPDGSSTPTELTPPSFTSAEGWVTEGTSDDPGAFDQQTPPTVWASSVAFDASDLHPVDAAGNMTEGTFPTRTMRSLSADDVVIVASLYSNGPGINPANYPERSLPLSLTGADIRLGWESQIAGNVPEYLILATVDGRPLQVRVFFGGLRPSDAALANAQGELARLVLPPNPEAPPGAAGAPAASIIVESPGSMMSAFGALWVQSGESVQRRDPSSGALVDTFDSKTGSSDGIATLTSGFGSVWWVAGRSVLRIDPETATISATIDLPSRGYSITEGEGSVWVGVESGFDLRIDPATDQITLRTSPQSSPSGSLAVGGGSVWSRADSEAARIERYDSNTGTMEASLPIDSTNLLYLNGSLWALSRGRTDSLLRLSPATGDVTDEVPLTGAGLGLTYSDGDFWVNSGGLPIRIDAATGKVLAQPSQPQSGYRNTAIAVAGGYVWLVVPDQNAIQSFPT